MTLSEQNPAEFRKGLEGEGLFEELWKACAGPLVEVPFNGERVFYFPQGHMEQLEESTNHELNHQIPHFDLPSKILCRVVNIRLLAEKETDEVYAQITLQPEADMRFEGEESPERRFTGTIVGVGDISPVWSDSKWRSLKIQWDEAAAIQRPERVSPWEIEPFVPSASLNFTHPSIKSKRARPVEVPPPENTSSSTPTGFWLHGSTIPHEIPQLSGANDVPSSGNQVVWSLWQQTLDVNVDSSRSHCNPMAHVEGIWPSPPPPLCNNSLKPLPSPYSPSSTSKPSSELIEHDQSEKGNKPDISLGCRIFGIDLKKNSSIVPSLEKKSCCQTTVATDIAKDPVPIAAVTSQADAGKEQQQVASELSMKGTQTNHIPNSSSRTRTKVQMQGVAVGRAVDLTTLKGYEDLIDELENVFEIKGELREMNKWSIVFTDDEYDMMLVGDDPWPEFCKMVKRIFIYSSEEVKTMSSNSKLVSPPSLDSLDSERKTES
ncbi:Auxin response factor 9, partial [Cucurbita argyrosperma subsp. sororia]